MGSPPMSGAVCLVTFLFAILPLQDWTLWLPIAIGLLLLFLLALVVILRRRRRLPKAPKAEQQVLPTAPEIKVQLPPSEAERARLEEAAQARSRAEQLAQERRAAAQAAEAAGSVEKTRLEDEARALKAREEEAKREAYRAAEAEERVREEEQRRKVEAQAGQTLAQGLSKTRSQGFIARLNGLFGQPKTLDESVLAELEQILFTADIGVQTASHLVQLARDKIRGNGVISAEALKSTLRTEIERILSLSANRSLEGGGPPHVVMVVGVNGSGKTTTIGKLAAQLTGRGKQVILAA